MGSLPDHSTRQQIKPAGDQERKIDHDIVRSLVKT
jgi:hypothetical protein